jgi:hypothetical protein
MRPEVMLVFVGIAQVAVTVYAGRKVKGASNAITKNTKAAKEPYFGRCPQCQFPLRADSAGSILGIGFDLACTNTHCLSRRPLR